MPSVAKYISGIATKKSRTFVSRPFMPSAADNLQTRQPRILDVDDMAMT